MDRKVASFALFLLVIVILAVIVIGCGGNDEAKKKAKEKLKEQQDKAKKDALKRNATVVAEEAKRLNLPVCTVDADCAKDGVNCNTFFVPATEPGVCSQGPTLNCVCPEKRLCFMIERSRVNDPHLPRGTALTIYYSGICQS